MKQELSIMQEAIMKAIKKHNKEREDLTKFNKCIKFESMGRYIKLHTDEYTITCFKDKKGENASMTRYLVKCRFKPDGKYDDNIVLYMICMHSNGMIGVYFDGTEYKMYLH